MTNGVCLLFLCVRCVVVLGGLRMEWSGVYGVCSNRTLMGMGGWRMRG